MAKGNRTKRGGFAEHPENINRSGRPKKEQTLNWIIDQVLLEPAGKSKLSKLEVIIRSMIDKALKGDFRYAEAVLNRRFGTARQTIEIPRLEDHSAMIIFDDENNVYRELKDGKYKDSATGEEIVLMGFNEPGEKRSG